MDDQRTPRIPAPVYHARYVGGPPSLRWSGAVYFPTISDIDWRTEHRSKVFPTWSSFARCAAWYEGHSQIIDTPPPFPNKTKDVSIELRFKYSRVLTVRVQSFFRPFEPRPKERKKVNYWQEAQRRPPTMINFPSSQNSHFPVSFLLILRTREISRWMED